MKKIICDFCEKEIKQGERVYIHDEEGQFGELTSTLVCMSCLEEGIFIVGETAFQV